MWILTGMKSFSFDDLCMDMLTNATDLTDKKGFKTQVCH